MAMWSTICVNLPQAGRIRDAISWDNTFSPIQNWIILLRTQLPEAYGRLVAGYEAGNERQ